MLHSFGAEEIQCNIDVQCKKKKTKTTFQLSSDLLSYKLQFSKG